MTDIKRQNSKKYKMWEILKVNFKQAHRLATHEDARFFHAHKIIGVSVLGHFAYRMWRWAQFGADAGLGLDDGSWTTLCFIFLHAALHVSSFQFVLPSRRNLVYNTIWPEMRWHSAFFAMRSIVILGLMWLQRNGVIGTATTYLMRSSVVIMTMIAADVTTRAYKANSSTIRDNPYPDWAPVWARRVLTTMYSVSQISATMIVLFRSEAPVFLSLLPIQTAPFLMTLVKKGLIAPSGWHLWYFIALLVNYCYNDPSFPITPRLRLIAASVVALRFGINTNKYVIWLGVIWVGFNQFVR